MRWDDAAAERAGVLVRRAHRKADASPQTREAARRIEAEIAAELARNTEWSDEERAVWAPAINSYLADVAAGEPPSIPLDGAWLARAFSMVYQPVLDPSPSPPPAVKAAIVDQFHRLYYHRAPQTWRNTYYRGHRILKLPLDLWVYAELIHKLQPELIIETGTRFGGSALWLADQLDLVGHGRVVTIDIDTWDTRPEHDRITYLLGSSTDPAIVEQVKAIEVSPGASVLVILDSDHSRDHVLAEMQAFAPLVPVGSYMIVEDTNINGHPVLPEFGPGPWEAVEEFLGKTDEFEVDHDAEKFFVTMNPGGYLRRVH